MKNFNCFNGDCYQGVAFQPERVAPQEEEYLEYKLRKDLTEAQIALAKSIINKYKSLLAAGWIMKKT